MRPTDFSRKINTIDDGRNRQTFWNILVKVYNEFSLQSTIHGIKYTTQAKSTVGRYLWLIIVALSIISASQLAYKFYERHESANMRTLVVSNQYPSWLLELPAITFCHSDIATVHRLKEQNFQALVNNKTFKLPFDTKLKDFQNSLKYLSIGLFPSSQYHSELYFLNKVLEVNNMTLVQLFELVGPKCDDFIIICQFEGTIEDCKNLITSSYTPYGICCSFNYALIQNEHRWNTSGKDYYSVNFGGRYVLSFLIKTYGNEDRISSMMYGDGIKVLVHERNTYPGPSALEFVAATGHETITRLFGRHLTASIEVLNLKPQERDCYTTKKARKLYRADNCYVACREKIFRTCGCVPFFSIEIGKNQQICNLTHISCLTRVKQKAYSITLRDTLCGCLPDCANTMYSLVATTIPFNAPQYNPSAFYQKAREILNATAIHITYSEQSSMLQRRELVLSWINLVSSLGGVFSLFLGCSFISIIEIIYFFVIDLILKLRDSRRVTRTTHRKAQFPIY